MKMNKKWVTLFERYESFHHVKDVGQIPFHANKILGYNSEIWRKANSGVLSGKPEGYEVVDIPSKRSGVKLSFSIITKLISESKNISVLNIFHFRYYSLIYAFFYKIFNRNGIVVLKCDGSDNVFPLQSKRKLRPFLFFFVKKLSMIDVMLVEHQSLMKFYTSYGIKCIYSPNGVTPLFYESNVIEKDNLPTLIFIGKCGDPRKNAESLVEALLQIKLEFRIFFVGGETAEFHSFFKNKTASLPAEIIGRFKFSGFIEEQQQVLEIYDKSHLFLMTSLHEGYPLSLSEACWRGCFPILSLGSGGRDMADAGCAAIYSNNMELVNILNEKLNNLSATKQLGKRSRQYVESNNDWRVIMKKVDEIVSDE